MEFKLLLKESWEEYTYQFSYLLLATAPYIFVSVLVALVSGSGVLSGSAFIWLSLFLTLILQAMILLVGLKYLYLKRGIQLSINSRNLINYLVAALVTSVATILGFVLLILPGLVVMSLLMITPIYVLKEGQGPLEAISSSLLALKGIWWQVTILFSLILMVFGLLDYLVTNVAGFMTIPEFIIAGISSALNSVLWLFSLPLIINLYNNQSTEHNQ